jgi:hypothetical protein
MGSPAAHLQHQDLGSLSLRLIHAGSAPMSRRDGHGQPPREPADIRADGPADAGHGQQQQ